MLQPEATNAASFQIKFGAVFRVTTPCNLTFLRNLQPQPSRQKCILKWQQFFIRHDGNHVPYNTVSWSLNCRWNLELSPATIYSSSTFQTRNKFPTSQGTDQSVQRLARGAGKFTGEATLFCWLTWCHYTTKLQSVDRPNSKCFTSFLPSDPLIRHFQKERAAHNRFPSRSGNCYSQPFYSPSSNVIAAATPFNKYSSMESPTIDSEGSTPHKTALSLQRTGPHLYKLYTISHPAQNINLRNFICRSWSYSCVQWTPQVLLIKCARETAWHTECEIKLKLSNIRLAVCGLMCVCSTMRKDGNVCSRKWLNIQNPISNATKFLTICKDVTNVTLLGIYVEYSHFGAINQFHVTL